MSRLIFLLLTFLLPATAVTQSPNEFHIQNFNTESGLPSNGIKGLQWDEQTGFLWIATEAGIVRYNGMEFKIYGKEDDPHITNERILFLVKNNDGKIYTADNSGSIFYTQKNSLKFLEKKQLQSDSGNNFISASVSEALYKTKIDFKKKGYSLQFDKTFPAGDTATYLTHFGDLLYYSQTVRSPVSVLNGQINISMGFKCDDNIFLVDNKKDVYLYNKTPVSVARVQIFENGKVLNEDMKEAIFIWENGMKESLLFIKEKAWTLAYNNGKLTATLICNSIPAGVLIRYAQYADKRKTLFIATDSKGIIIIEKKKVESLKLEKATTQRTSYYSQVELKDKWHRGLQ